MSGENELISTPWCTVSELLVGILGCLLSLLGDFLPCMSIVVGCENHELHELSCFLPCLDVQDCTNIYLNIHVQVDM